MIKTLYPVFQPWSAKGSVYIISDTHFEDSDREFMGYHLSEAEQMEYLKICHKNDTLIHLGDVGNPEYLKPIRAHKVLIMGNHDETATKFEPYFDEIYTGPVWIAEKLVLSHEPLLLESAITQNAIAFNIHGHDHSGECLKDDMHLNLAQNVFGYEPLSLKTFIEAGGLAKVKSIHREIIDNATKKKKEQ